MARTQEEIRDEIITEIQTYSELDDLDAGGNFSQTADWYTWTNIFSTIINVLEQLFDVFSVNIDTKILQSRVGNARWLQDKVFKFQYDENNRQIPVVTDTFSVEYPIINEDLQIVKACSVQQQPNRQVFIKAAKEDINGDLEALNQLEATALESYLSRVKFAGTQVILIKDPFTFGTLAPDRIYIDATVFFDGQYVLSNIQQAVEDSLKEYFKNLDFDGFIVIQEIERVILDIEGVYDLKLEEVIRRANNEPLGSILQTKVYNLAEGINIRRDPTAAGYIIPEDTVGNTFADTINYSL